MRINSEEERKSEAISYVQERIYYYTADLGRLDWSEDVDGNWVYEPGNYSEERRTLSASLREWEKMLSILQKEIPFHIDDL